jgi:hypothetical protein
VTADTVILERITDAPAAPVRPAVSRPHQALYWLPLVLILAAQAALTIRLFGFATTDEGRYLFAGHALWDELFHGGGSPYFETYFSGAPDIYPPLAAIADNIGGFAAVRLMSLDFMLLATSMMFCVTRKLFGYWPAVLSCGLYAGLFVTQAVGRNIIYDAMAISVLSVAAYCAARAESGASAFWLLATVPVIVFADFTKYVMVIFDPAVIAIAAYQIRSAGWSAMIRRVLVLGFTTAFAFVGMAFIAGTAYWKGMLWSTFGRQTGQSALLDSVFEPTRVLVSETLGWEGAVIGVALASVVLAIFFATRTHRLPLVALLSVLSLTCLAVVIEAIHLHSNESTGRHTAFAAWFGCVAAGSAFSVILSRLTQVWRVPAITLCSAAVVLSGFHYSFQNHDLSDLGGLNAQHEQIPPYFVTLRPYMVSETKHYLIDGDHGYQLISVDELRIPWWDLTDDNYIKYPIPGRGGSWHWTTPGRTCTLLRPGCQYLTGAAGYTAAIHNHAFALISLHRFTLTTDTAILNAVKHTPGYVLLTNSGGGPTWIYAPDYGGKV